MTHRLLNIFVSNDLPAVFLGYGFCFTLLYWLNLNFIEKNEIHVTMYFGFVSYF